jgi:hypothetical protein
MMVGGFRVALLLLLQLAVTAASGSHGLDETIHTWLQERGGNGFGLNSALSNQSIAGKGFGLTSTKQIKKGELLMSIPLSATINNHSCMMSAVGKVLNPKFAADIGVALADGPFPDYNTVALTMCLLHEQSRGAESAYFPYLRMLPTELDQVSGLQVQLISQKL